MNRGSVWRKWDLHVHTPASYSNEFKLLNSEEREKYQDNIWEKYIDELEKISDISDISVIGITDYFTIEGYKKVLEYRNSHRLQKFDLILPNIEFRINQKNKDGDFINLHVIFSDKVPVNKIEEVLTRLPLISTDDKTLTSKYCTKRDLRNLGYERAIVNHGKLVEQLKRDLREIDEFLIIGVARGYGSIRPSKDDGRGAEFAKEIDKLSRAFFGNENDVNFYLNKESGREQHNLPPKPVIYCSDAHKFEDIGSKFTWIKADPSFEGLKQIIYEPEERVRIQRENPEHIKNIYTLDYAEIKDSCISSDLSIEELMIHLNKNLIAVTGGKGSGKTALLDLIANCFDDRCKRAGVGSNSFVGRIEDQKGDLMVQIGFIGEGLQPFSKQIAEQEFVEGSRITYLPQGAIEAFSVDRDRLNRRIEEIIFSNKEVVDKRYQQEFDDLKDEIAMLVRQIDEKNRQIYKLEQETKEDIMSGIKSEKAVKEGELKNKEHALSKLTEGMQDDTRKEISELKEKQTDKQLRCSQFQGLRNRLKQLKVELEEFSCSSDKTIVGLNNELSDLQVAITIPSLDFAPQIQAIDKILEVIDQNVQTLAEQIGKAGETLSSLLGAQKTHVGLINSIGAIKTEIRNMDEQLCKLTGKKESKELHEEERKRQYHDLLLKYRELKTHYKMVIDAFSKDKTEILNNVDFVSSIHFRKNDFVEQGIEMLDLRMINEDYIKKHAKQLENITANIDNTSEQTISDFLSEILKMQPYLKKATRSSYDFYKWVFDDYFSLNTRIFFRESPMDKLSIGQKGTVLLKLVLAEGEHPLIVDQPEENLDNKYIYEELVGAFRDAQKRRQIIIATNNANLVVNTDAEQIIVADFENTKISYKSGALEDLEMRRDIIPILEGGKEAFRKREAKYGIQGYGG